ncbi:CvpA family protein [Buchnera aphidicola]|uniref:CvpA family protein n=1 Tax=Buchnera aphidicola TaxID=9 RepID=UPI0039671C98
MHISYYDIILGGFFGIFRGLLLVFLLLFVFNYMNKNSYNYYLNNSILISIFLKFIKYFLSF